MDKKTILLSMIIILLGTFAIYGLNHNVYGAIHPEPTGQLTTLELSVFLKTDNQAARALSILTVGGNIVNNPTNSLTPMTQTFLVPVGTHQLIYEIYHTDTCVSCISNAKVTNVDTGEILKMFDRELKWDKG